MKKFTYLLILSLIVLIILIVPYFENVPLNPPLQFFGGMKSFVSVYFLIITLSMIEGVLIFLTVKELVNYFQDNKPKKFDLNG